MHQFFNTCINELTNQYNCWSYFSKLHWEGDCSNNWWTCGCVAGQWQ